MDKIHALETDESMGCLDVNAVLNADFVADEWANTGVSTDNHLESITQNLDKLMMPLSGSIWKGGEFGSFQKGPLLSLLLMPN